VRTSTWTGTNRGRVTALLMVVMAAALVAVGLGRPQPALATSCQFRLLADGVTVSPYTAVHVTADHVATEGEGAGGGFHIVVQKVTAGCVGGVDLWLSAGSAMPPGDYNDIPESDRLGLPFQIDEPVRELNIFPNDDGVIGEPNETFTVTIAPHSGDTIDGPVSRTLTIVDNDGLPKYSFASASSSNVEEDPPGTHIVNVQVTRSGSTAGTDSIVCKDKGTGTATGGGVDYTLSSQTLTFSPGETTENCQVTIVEDNINEGDQTVILEFGTVTGFTGGAGAHIEHTLTITDDDGTGTARFKLVNYIGVEGTTASFAVERVNGNDGVLNATCGTVQNGTAIAGTDYTATPVGGGALSWGDGDTSDKFCQVQILADGDLGTGETFGLTLSGTVSAPTSATVTINDVNGTGIFSFTQTTFPGTENGGAITVTVQRTSGSAGIVTVDVATTTVGSTATANVDYTPVSTTLTFANGDTIETFTVTPINDLSVEGLEFVNVVLSNAQGGATIGSPSLAQVNISDDESPLPVVTSVSPASGSIGGGTAITIGGINFTGATSVLVGGSLCTSLVVVNATTITCVTPAHAGGTFDVIVTTPAGSSSGVGTSDDFTYTGGPTITLLTPNTGQASGNTIVTITGTNFTSSGTQVRFDNILAVHNFIDSTTLIAVAPPHSAGTVRVTVTTPGGTTPDTAADDFTYTGTTVPVITGLSPATGGVGTTVVITGSGFTGASLVTFGGVASVYTVNSDSQITATVPATTPSGTVDVRVTTPNGTSANTAADNFTNTSGTGALVTYTLYFRFTLIVWTGPNNISALAALRGQESPDNPNTNNVSALVGAIWRFDPVTQTFKGYFPGSDGVPGANDFTTLQNGVGYFIALLNPGTVTWTTLSGS